MTGAFCPSCGQEYAAADRLSLWGLMADFVDDLFPFDLRFFRTLRLLVLRPGFLSREYVVGRRIAYLPPFEIFALVVLLYAVVAEFSGGTILSQLSEDSTLLTWAEEAGESVEDYRGHLDEVASAVQPFLAFVFVPLFAGVLALVQARRRVALAAHAVFVLHFLSFWLLLLIPMALLPRGAFPLWMLLLTYGPLVYLTIALRRVYSQTWPRTLGKAVVVWLLFLALIAAWMFCGIVVSMVWISLTSGS